MSFDQFLKWVASFLIGLGLLALGWKWTWVMTTLFVMICFVLIIVVLLQSGKAADLAGAFGGAGSQTAFGPRGAATFLSKATTWCAVMFMITAMVMVKRQSMLTPSSGSSVLEKTQKQAPAPEQKGPTIPPAGPLNLPPQSNAPTGSSAATPPATPATGTQPAGQPQSSQPAPTQQPAKPPAKQ